MAAAAAMFAACSDDAKELNAPEVATNPTEEVAQQQDIPVAFGAYVNRATTRAGQAGDMNNDKLQTDWDPTSTKYGGFGVFGYYTDNNEYDQLATPNFMYNQLVKYSSGAWSYDPVRYWPNEYGSTAVSDDSDKVTFFAYAPYVEVNGANGKPTADNNGDATTGITQLSRNTASGDPIVKYIGSFDTNKAVDLLWGVNNENTWVNVSNGGQQEFEAGKPWVNVLRPNGVDQKLKFTFRHALAKMQIKVNTFNDGFLPGDDVDSKTKIFIRQITFNGFAMQGALNLNNEDANKPYWMNYNGIGDLESDGDLTVYDGRRDGKEGMANAEASNEKSRGLKTQFIQKEGLVENNAWKTGTIIGVTKDLTPLFENGGIFYVIPVEGEQVKVEIVYDVETIDPNMGYTLSDGVTKGTTIENRISKDIIFGSSSNLEAGKAYEINLHLGMNSVKFDANVVDWDDMQPGSDIDLPANMSVYTAGNPMTTPSVELPGYKDPVTANQDYYVFAVDGLTGGETVEATDGSILTDTKLFSTGVKLAAGTEDKTVNNSGVVYVKAKVGKYYGVENKDEVADVRVIGAHGNSVQLKVKMLAVKLGLTEPVTKTAGTTAYTLKRMDGTQDLGWSATETYAFTFPALNGYTAGTSTNNYIRVWLNGAEQTKADDASQGKFKFDTTSGELTVYGSGASGATVAGDVIKVTIKTGDVAEETISFTVVGS